MRWYTAVATSSVRSMRCSCRSISLTPNSLADATREAQHIRAEADARAAAAYARAYARNPEFAAFYRSMQAYKNTLGLEGDILVIAPEGDFFKYLHGAGGR